ncbi:hypothetical protein F2P56_031191 [Juglans regia]|uniref:Myrcene synthase, chloroplastic-like n=2 Tax=Juglans regia TaxID=51240 RepID=A0A833TLY7_JUGRE|nr:myrcene synthase, chloroplastic-like [Juglans regia]KAF5450875.1 hypothetical protein F2P56_031191 [Juglans regia]
MYSYILDSIQNYNPTVHLPSANPISLQTTRTSTVPCPPQSMVSRENSSDSIVVRRSANYKPTIWHYDCIRSLTSEYVGDSFNMKIANLKGEVTTMLHKALEPLKQLELIDILQRLGLSYHFEDDIRRILSSIYNTNRDYPDMCKKKRLYATALEFRLLRQNRYNVPQEIFKSFTNEKESFKECLCNDTEGMLALYEASFLLLEGENILEEARDFATKHLKDYVKQSKDQNLCAMVNHALELPLHWRMLRLETNWFIDAYRSKKDANPIFLELATLDFNVVQAVHQEELKEVSNWWRSTCIVEKMSFARDRLMANFLWTLGVSFQPEFGYNRKMLTKVNSMITTIDDMYDIHGTLDELELFTNVVERWDVNAMEQLPYYMQICFLNLHNLVNEIVFHTLKEKELNIIRFLHKVWADLCRSYFLEAKWYYNGYTPSLQEYIENAWISISGPVILVHAYVFITNPLTKEALDGLEEYPNMIRWSSTIVRLAGDLGTYVDELERGDVPKSIQCYMNDAGVSEKDARQFISSLISTIWKKINEERLSTTSPFSQIFTEITMNLSRMAQCIYQYGDGHGTEDRETMDQVLALLVHPITLPKDQYA